MSDENQSLAKPWAQGAHFLLGAVMVVTAMTHPHKSIWTALTNFFGWVYIVYGASGSENIINALGCTTTSTDKVKQSMSGMTQMLSKNKEALNTMAPIQG